MCIICIYKYIYMYIHVYYLYVYLHGYMGMYMCVYNIYLTCIWSLYIFRCIYMNAVSHISIKKWRMSINSMFVDTNIQNLNTRMVPLSMVCIRMVDADNISPSIQSHCRCWQELLYRHLLNFLPVLLWRRCVWTVSRRKSDENFREYSYI